MFVERQQKNPEAKGGCQEPKTFRFVETKARSEYEKSKNNNRLELNEYLESSV